MKKAIMVVFLMMGFSVANAFPFLGALTAIGSTATTAAVTLVVVDGARMSSDDADLFKTVTVNQKGHGYNGTMTKYEFDRSDKSVWSLVN